MELCWDLPSKTSFYLHASIYDTSLVYLDPIFALLKADFPIFCTVLYVYERFYASSMLLLL